MSSPSPAPASASLTRAHAFTASVLGALPLLFVAVAVALRPDLSGGGMGALMLGIAFVSSVLGAATMLVGWALAMRTSSLRKPLHVLAAAIALLAWEVPGALAPLVISVFSAALQPAEDLRLRPLIQPYDETSPPPGLER